MFSARLSVAGLVLAASLGGACMPGVPAGSNGSGGAAVAGSGGSSGSTGGSGSTGTGGGSGGAMSAADAGAGSGGLGGATDGCERSPPRLHPTGTILDVPIDLTYEGEPFVYGEANAVNTTQSVLPLNIRFYLSAIELVTGTGAVVPVDVVTAAGDVQPYGVFMFNAEDPTMLTLHLRAPAGTYSGVKFDLGLNVPCNTGSSFSRTFPLSEDSQMTWPHLVGYLFFRYEAQVSSTGADPDGGAQAVLPGAIHMGADVRDLKVPGAITFRVNGVVSLPPAGGRASKHLRLAMDQIFKGATTPIDVSDVPFVGGGPETVAGERLRRTAAGLPIFGLGD